jgi:hypothetical protein
MPEQKGWWEEAGDLPFTEGSGLPSTGMLFSFWIHIMFLVPSFDDKAPLHSYMVRYMSANRSVTQGYSYACNYSCLRIRYNPETQLRKRPSHPLFIY